MEDKASSSTPPPSSDPTDPPLDSPTVSSPDSSLVSPPESPLGSPPNSPLGSSLGSPIGSPTTDSPLDYLDTDDWDIPERSPTPPDLFIKKMDKDQPLKQVHQRVNNDVAELLKRYENIMACANMERTSHAAIAAESTQIDVEVNAIVRAAEDILSLTRSMKEAWLFGTLDTLGESSQDVERNEKLEDDVKAVEKAIEAGAFQKLCPEDDKTGKDKQKEN